MKEAREDKRKRFDDELISLLLEWKWWDKPVEEINRLIPVLTDGDLTAVKVEIQRQHDR